MEARRLQAAELPLILPIYKECARWLKGKGIRQWGHYLNEEGRVILERRFRDGEVYAFEEDGQILGTLTLQLQDSFWEDLGKDPRCLYLHSVAVSRAFKGRGLGAKMIGWACDQAHQRSRALLRLDTLAENPRLCRYYEELGFLPVAEKRWEEDPLRLYEKSC